MREPIPYSFEILPSNGGLWVFNTTAWADRDCIVTCSKGKNIIFSLILPAQSKAVIIDSLENEVEYIISISRKDFAGKLKYRKTIFTATPSSRVKKYLVLVGASVSFSWQLPGLSERIKKTDYCFGYRGLSEFDKLPIITLLQNSPKKPDMVVLKECAAYFPRAVDESVASVNTWMSKLKESGILPILATVVPVTENYDNANNNKVMTSIIEFNNAIRMLGKKQSIPVLDLHKELSNNNGYLDETYAAADGLHLNGLAYKDVLDSYLSKSLEELDKH